jgi:ABC-2 type transport system permease protein
MTWQIIARLDGETTLQSKTVKYLLAFLGLGILLAAYIYPVTAPDPITTARFTGYVSGWLTTLVPLVGVLLGYNAVVSERESGSLLLSLSLPHSRTDVLVGKFLSRAGLVAATMLAALLVGGALVVYPYGDLELVRSLAFLVLALLYGALWTGLAVAVSLSVATKRRALALSVGALLVFVFLWGTLRDLLRTGLVGAGFAENGLPDPIAFLFNLSPNRAFTLVTEGFLDPGGSVGGPWFLGEWVALVVFAVWLVGPLGLAWLRFAGRDLS